MAIRLKTVEYALDTNRDVKLNGTDRVFSPLSVYFPETASRNFKNCFVEYFISDVGTIATNFSTSLHKSTINNTLPYVTSSVPTLLSNTGENYNWYQHFDVTSLFINNVSPTDTSCSFNLITFTTGSALGYTDNATAKLICTYEYNDSVNRRVKTVYIPMNSTQSGISSTAITFIDTIPALDSYLPEENKVYRNIFIELRGNDSCASNQGIQSASFIIDNSIIHTTGQINTSLSSQRSFNYIVNLNSLDTSITHSFSARSSVSTLAFYALSPVCVVTYEYDHDISNKVMNYVAFVAADESGVMGGTTKKDAGRFFREINIQEPEVTMSRCGVYHTTSDSDVISLVPFVSSLGFEQSSLTYNLSTGTPNNCGCFFMSHRFDSQSVQGAGINLQRGFNKMYNSWYRTTADVPGKRGTAYSALAILNYVSGKSSLPGGEANHSHVIKQLYAENSGSITNYYITTASIYIPESDYWLTSFGATIFQWGAPLGGFSFVVNATASNEGYDGIGWEDAFSTVHNSDGEVGPYIFFVRLGDIFRKFPNDPNTEKYIPGINRKCYTTTYNSAMLSGYLFYSYHTISYPLTGSITGYGGNGSGIDVNFFRTDNNDLVLKTTSSIGGSFSGKWYDNVTPLYAIAYQDKTRLGRSTNSTASGIP